MKKSLFFKSIRLFASLILFATAGMAYAQSPSSVITLDMDNVPLETVLDSIEEQSNYLFLNDQVDLSRTVSISVTDVPVKDALDQLFDGLGISWRISGVNIYISNIASQEAGSGQDDVISGTIIDETGFPVIGAGVLIQGTTTGASTDIDGRFSFNLPAGGGK